MTTITSNTTYSSKSNANRAARKVVAQHPGAEVTVWRSAAGWNYRVEVPAPVQHTTNRGGGRKFMTGKQIRRTPYQPLTQSDTVFQICAFLRKEMAVKVPHLSHVVTLAESQGVKATTARAAYTHYKQVHKLNVKAGRATPEANEKFASLATKFIQ